MLPPDPSPLDAAAALAALTALADATGPDPVGYPEVEEALAGALALHHASLIVRRQQRVPLVRAGQQVASAAAEEPLPAALATGSVGIVPAPGSVPGLDEERAGIVLFRTLQPGVVLGRQVPAGARLLVSRREPEPGDAWVLKGAAGLIVGEAGPGDRRLGVVEAVIA